MYEVDKFKDIYLETKEAFHELIAIIKIAEENKDKSTNEILNILDSKTTEPPK